MKNELEVLNRNICVQGCTFSRTGLRFDVVEEGVLTSVGSCLQEMAKANDWWWGDYLAAWVDFKIAKDGFQPADEQDKEKMRRFWVRNHVSVLNGDEIEEVQTNRYRLSCFYKFTLRNVNLSKDHHRFAMDAASGDICVAQKWLEKAATLKWTANRLRAEIRGETRKQAGATTSKETVTQQWLFDARMGAAAQMNRVDDMDADEAGFLLAQLAPVLALANALALRFGPAAAGVGGKESIAGPSGRR
jgi:hypothetical protein